MLVLSRYLQIISRMNLIQFSLCLVGAAKLLSVGVELIHVESKKGKAREDRNIWMDDVFRNFPSLQTGSLSVSGPAPAIKVPSEARGEVHTGVILATLGQAH